MPSPLFDDLHLRLSRMIADDVASAATSGNQASSANRTDYLNRANTMIQNIIFRLGKDAIYRFLSGLKKTQTITWSSSGTSLASDYRYWLEAQYDTSPVTILMWYPSKVILDAGENINLQNVFTIDAGKIYGYYAGTILSSGTGKLIYLASDQRASNGDTVDIGIDTIWHDALVELAASIFFKETKNYQHSEVLKNEAMADINLILQR